jgi:hypothetical protein
MVDLVARVVTLDSRKRRLGLVMSGHPEELVEIGQHFVRESHCLLLEADIWGNSLSALPQHTRVTVSAAGCESRNCVWSRMRRFIARIILSVETCVCGERE